MVGFNHVLVIAVAFYLLSAVCGRPVAQSRAAGGDLLGPVGASPSRQGIALSGGALRRWH